MSDETRDASAPEADLSQLSEQDRALLETLRCAWQPHPLAEATHESLLAQALNTSMSNSASAEATLLEEEFSSDEIACAAALRLALEDAKPAADANLLRALQAAAQPAALAPEAHEALISAALGSALKRRRPTVAYAVFGSVGAALALAAGFVLLFRPLLSGEAARQGQSLIPARSTTVLFDHAFEPGKTSERMDRIASARARDLRSNRYRAWGVE